MAILIMANVGIVIAQDTRIRDIKKCEKLFNEGIEGGKDKYGRYIIKNSKPQKVGMKSMLAYIKKKGYIPVAYESQILVRKFSSWLQIFGNAEIIEPSELNIYLVRIFRNYSGYDMNDITGNGYFFKPEKEKVYEKKNKLISVLVGTKDKLVYTNNVNWFGEIVDGAIHGLNTGFIAWDDNKKVLVFHGEFRHGLPVTTISGMLFKFENDFLDCKQEKFSYSPVTMQMVAENLLTEDPKLKKALNSFLVYNYDQAVSKIENLYNSIKSVNITNYNKIGEIDRDLLRFIYNYELSGYDPQNMLPKAKELNDIYGISYALEFPLRDKYYGFNLWSLLSMYEEWLQDDVDNHRKILQSGIDLARKGKNNSRYGFKTFCGKALQQLENKKSNFEKKVREQKNYYDRKRSKEMARRQNDADRYSKEIDWSRSKSPSGELTSSFFSTYYYFENGGEIYFKGGGERIKYNAMFLHNDYNSFSHFIITFVSNSNKFGHLRDRNFKTREEMLDAIIKAL